MSMLWTQCIFFPGILRFKVVQLGRHGLGGYVFIVLVWFGLILFLTRLSKSQMIPLFPSPSISRIINHQSNTH